VAVAGTLLVLLAATRIPVVARVLATPGTAARLALPHTLRVVGVTFLLVMAQGHLPAIFALPAGLGDIAAGLAAPFVARRLAHGGRARAVWFNLFGLLDLVVALTIGFPAGLAAPLVARRLTQGTGRGRAVWFHLFGILDLVVALSIGFLAGLGPWRPLEVTPSTEPLSLLPLALVPTVAVPLAIALHLVSLSRLRAAVQPERDRSGDLLPAGS
jgi:hypothetical protein